MNADPQVMEHFPATLSRAESDELAGRAQAALDERGFGLWAVEIAGEQPFIGFTGLALPRFDAHFTPAVEIGWRLARQWWGRGYATEAARRVLEFAFQDLLLPEVVSFATVANVRSQAVMARIGMTHDPADDFDHPLLGQRPLRRHVLWRITSGMWKAQHGGAVEPPGAPGQGWVSGGASGQPPSGAHDVP